MGYGALKFYGRLFLRNVYRTAGRDASVHAKGPYSASTTIVGSYRVGGNPTLQGNGGGPGHYLLPPRWGRPWGDTVRDPWI
jgi:hypothetical protein